LIKKKKKDEDGDLEKEFQPINTVANVNQTHDFFLDKNVLTTKEKAFLEENECDEDNDVEMSMNNKNGVDVSQITPTEKEEIGKISVENPLKLPINDPLLWDMKVKQWAKQKYKST